MKTLKKNIPDFCSNDINSIYIGQSLFISNSTGSKSRFFDENSFPVGWSTIKNYFQGELCFYAANGKGGEALCSTSNPRSSHSWKGLDVSLSFVCAKKSLFTASYRFLLLKCILLLGEQVEVRLDAFNTLPPRYYTLRRVQCSQNGGIFPEIMEDGCSAVGLCLQLITLVL